MPVHTMKHLMIFLLVFLLMSCAEETQNATKTNTQDKYDFSSAQMLIELPEELQEISGIALFDENTLLCIQDERGVVYDYNLTEKKINNTLKFADSADYEELALAGNDLFVLESNGNLYQIKNFRDGGQKPLVHNTALKEEHNAEGLCYLKNENKLLIACKDKPSVGEKNRKAFYRFDLNNSTLEETPAFYITAKDLKDFAKANKKSLGKRIEDLLEENKIDEILMPSGLAQHPLTNDIYILSSKNSLLVITDKSGKIKDIHSFNGKDFAQPEGITFSSKGDLYISNEGKKRDANIAMFGYEK